MHTRLRTFRIFAISYEPCHKPTQHSGVFQNRMKEENIEHVKKNYVPFGLLDVNKATRELQLLL